MKRRRLPQPASLHHLNKSHSPLHPANPHHNHQSLSTTPPTTPHPHPHPPCEHLRKHLTSPSQRTCPPFSAPTANSCPKKRPAVRKWAFVAIAAFTTQRTNVPINRPMQRGSILRRWTNPPALPAPRRPRDMLHK